MKMDIITTSYNTDYLEGMNSDGSSSGYYVYAKNLQMVKHYTGIREVQKA